MINKLWFFLIVIGLIFGFVNNKDMSSVILNSASNSYNLIVSLGPLIVLWSGIMCIAEKSGLLYKFSLFIRPVLKILFPKIKGETKWFDVVQHCYNTEREALIVL